MLEMTELERFVERYADKAYSYAYGLCNNEPDARELVQAAFVKLFDSAGTYDGRQASLENWFLTILRNVHLDFVRRVGRKRGLSLDMPVGTDGVTLADALPDDREKALIARLESEEDGERVRAALGQLSPALRSVAMLVDMDGLRYEEAAKVLDCPLNTIRSRIVRARIALRQRLLDMEATS